jgi:hypothetical protein
VVELELRSRSWVRARTVDDRSSALVVHRRAQALLSLAKKRLVRVSWRAWLAADAQPQLDDATEEAGSALEPTPQLVRLVRIVEALARGEVVLGLEHWNGAPRHALDPRLLAIDELASIAGISASELDERTHRDGARIDKLLEEAMVRLRSGCSDVVSPAAPSLAHVPSDGSRIHRPSDEDDDLLDDQPDPLDSLGEVWTADGDEDLDTFYEEYEPVPAPETWVPDPEDTDAVIVVKAVCGVARVRGQFPLSVVADLLVGAPSACLETAGLDGTKTFGVLRGHSKAWVEDVLARCESYGLIARGRTSSWYELTELGAEVMRGSEVIEFEMPDRCSEEWVPE